MIGMVVMGHTIDQQLGEGGMGSVWRAISNHGHCSAVKVMHPHMLKNPMLAARFLREADNAQAIVNPHVAKVVAVETLPDGRTAIAMHYVNGKPLSDFMRGRLPIAVAERALGEPSALAIITQLCDGIQAAHRAGVVHRDIKPDNIMICKEPVPDWIVMLDFGISKRLLAGGDLTGDRMMMGTPSYMAPEQARDAASVTGAADIFSAAVICVELITGRRPYADPHGAEDSPESIITRYAEIRAGARPTPRLTDLARRANGEPLDIPPAWLEHLQEAISVHPEQRPQTAREFIKPLLDAIPDAEKEMRFIASSLIDSFGPDDETRRVRAAGATVSAVKSLRPAPAEGGTVAAAAGQFATPAPRTRRRAWVVPAAIVGGAAVVGLAVFGLTRNGGPHAAAAPAAAVDAGSAVVAPLGANVAVDAAPEAPPPIAHELVDASAATGTEEPPLVTGGGSAIDAGATSGVVTIDAGTGTGGGGHRRRPPPPPAAGSSTRPPDGID